jgi:PAS domain S-box-containing protein
MPTNAMTPSLPFLGLGSEESLRAMADALPDGLFTTDCDGIVTFWNRAAERITGWTREEALGQACSILAGDAVNGCSCGVGPIRCGLVERSKSSKCCTIRTKDGRERLIVKNAVPLHAPDGTPLGALESFTDVDGVPGARAPAAGGSCAIDLPAGPPARREDADFCGLAGRHPAMLELYRMIELVARSGSTVMILGESGAGKERVAEALHRMSARAAGPFVRVSCAALDEHLLESELFGHVEGAFPGALRERRGRLQEANGGTLLLDEIGDVSPVVQAKLLRVIEARALERVGDSRPIPVDVRLLCATHRDLKSLVAAGRFRADLYFRLAVFPLRVPPLREHPEDVPLLAERFLAPLRREHGALVGLAPAALQLLRAYPWPGNVRELQNALEYAALQAGPAAIGPEHLPADVRSHRPPAPAHVDAGADERRVLVEALDASGWNRRRAAEALGVSRVTLWKRMKRHGVGDPGEN